MFRWILLTLVLIPAAIQAAELSTVCHNELLAWMRAGRPLSIVDIQGAEDFRAHNYEGALATGSDPARINSLAARLQGEKGEVIVVSATGGADAQQAAERLARGGVERSRIYVLEGGMEAAAKKAACDCCISESAGLATQ